MKRKLSCEGARTWDGADTIHRKEALGLLEPGAWSLESFGKKIKIQSNAEVGESEEDFLKFSLWLRGCMGGWESGRLLVRRDSNSAHTEPAWGRQEDCEFQSNLGYITRQTKEGEESGKEGGRERERKEGRKEMKERVGGRDGERRFSISISCLIKKEVNCMSWKCPPWLHDSCSICSSVGFVIIKL